MLVRYCIIIILCYVTTVKLESPSVIIVGAGASGIAAATKLLSNGITNITILEAENRIGGRIYSVKMGDKYGDLGAEYCHGEKDNIVYELVQNFDLLDRKMNFWNEEFYYSNGSKLDQEVTELLQEFNEDTGNLTDNYNATYKSLGELLSHRYNSTLLKKFENDENKHKLLKEGLRVVESYIIGMEGTYSWFDSSAQSNYKNCEGQQNLIWKGTGYKIILDVLTKSYPDPSQKLPIDDKIQLNTEVSKIFWNQEKNPTVLTSNNRSYSADYVIFTPSIGVLKQQKDILFEPILPTTKQNAIEAIGMAGVMKIFIYFPEKWWINDDTTFVFYWSEEDLRSTDVPPTKNGVSWVSQILAIIREPYLTNMWVAWVGRELIPEIEQLSPDAIKNGCEYVLNKFLGKDYNISQIGYVLPTKWVTNQHFLGTYSYLKAGMYKEGVSYQKIISEPLKNEDGKPNVLFAGEATNPYHYSTVQGAIETGFREAERIINLSKNTNAL